MDTILWLFIGFVVLILAVIVFAAISGVESRKDADRAAASIAAEHGTADTYVSAADRTTIGISWDRKVLVVGRGPTKLREYPFDQLYQVDLDLDGRTVTVTTGTTKTRRGSQLAGAAAGGLLFGPAGLLVGGFTGGTKSRSTVSDQQLVKSLALVLYFRDREEPVQRVTFLSMKSGRGIPADNPILKRVAQGAERYAVLLTQIIEENGPPSSALDTKDVSAELERLWELREKGALTLEEFEDRKRKLLRS